MAIYSYKDITIFGNLARVHRLEAFRVLILRYFEETGVPEENAKPGQSKTPETKPPAKISKIRQAINESAHPVLDILQAAQVKPTRYVDDREVHLLLELFQLDRDRIPHITLIDALDRGIGVYKHDRLRALLRTLNPFFYLAWLVRLLSDLTFFSLGWLGFNGQAMQRGVLGSLVKGLFALLVTIITLCSASLSIADHLGWQPDLDGYWNAQWRYYARHYSLPGFIPRHVPHWLEF